MVRFASTPIITDNKCEYGCGTIARYKFKNGKLCCSAAIQQCQGHINKVINSKKHDLDDQGRNALQRGQHAAHLKKLASGSYSLAGLKISETKNQLDPETNKRRCDVSNQKMRTTKLALNDEGITNASASARKAALTRLMDIDDQGLNQYQRWTKERIERNEFEENLKKSFKIKNFYDSTLVYQGSYELKFLEKLKQNYGLDWVLSNVRRGPVIEYTDENDYRRKYLSDFIIGNTIYEIKSNWTFNQNGKNLLSERRNILKLIAAKHLGYRVILVKEGIEIEY